MANNDPYYNAYGGGYIIARSQGTPDITVTPTLTVGGTFATGDYVGTSGTCMTFTGCALEAGKGGFVLGADLIDGSGATGVAAELWVFDAAVTPPNDNAAWSISDADAKKKVCVIPFSTYYASALNCTSEGQPASNGGKHFTSVTGNLFGCLVTRGAPVYANGDVIIRLSVMPD
jgi:hypothetical protein